MPRIGMNPSRGQKTTYRPARVTLAVLTYLPEEIGYFENRFEVTRLCIESMIQNTPEPFDLMVFDNGSSPRLVEYLVEQRDAGRIDYLILSEKNIGKVGALQIMFRAAPGEIVAYTDDDVFFLPGWLDEHIRLLEIYPKVGLVTGFYIRSHMRYATQSLEAFKQTPEVTYTEGMLVSEDVERHYMENVGRTWEQYQEENKGLQDLRFVFQGVPALASAGHHQLVAYRDVLLEAFPKGWDGKLMGRMVEFEEIVDSLGYLRLSTEQPVTRLIGNQVNPEMAQEALLYGVTTRSVAVKSESKVSALAANWLVRKILVRAYNFLHRILHT